MIFVTVGNLDPFDRLIRAFDEWLAEQPGPVEAIAQIGTGTYRPQHCRWVDFLTPTEYRETFSQAKLVVSHAGMGTIITALEHNKPIIIMPKRASLGEQRNEHQLATARQFRRSACIKVADDADALHAALANLAAHATTCDTPPPTTLKAHDSLIHFLARFIHSA